MRCVQALEAVASEWGTGAGLSAPVREHLAACASCAAERGRIAEALAGVSAYDVPDPGEEYWEGFLSRVRARIDEAPPAAAAGFLARLREALLSPPWGPARLASAAALAVILAGAAAARWGWLGGAGAEGSRIEEQLDEKLLAAGDDQTLAVEDTLAASASSDLLEEEDLDPDSLQEAVGEVIAALSPGSVRGWDEMDDWIEELSEDESKALLEQLEPDMQEPSGDVKEEPKG